MLQVQHAICLNAHIKHGAAKFDYLKLQQVAAHEHAWKELFAPMRIFDLE